MTNQSTTTMQGSSAPTGRRGSWASVAANALSPGTAPLIPTAILDPTSRQAKWAAYETQRRASLHATDPSSLMNHANGVHSRSKSRSPTKNQSKSPQIDRRHRPSVSDIHDEVVYRSVSPPTANAGSAESDHRTSIPFVRSDVSIPFRPRRGSTPSLPSHEFGVAPSNNNSIDLHNISRLTGNNLGSNSMSSHAAYLLNLASKAKETKPVKNVRLSEPQEHGASRPSKLDDDLLDEEYDKFEIPTSVASNGRSRSKSISTYDPVQGRMREFHVTEEPNDLAAIWGRVQSSHRPGTSTIDSHTKSGTNSNMTSSAASPMINMIPHRRSSTLTYTSSPWNQSINSSVGETTPPQHQNGGAYLNSIPQHMQNAQVPFTSLPSSPDRIDQLRTTSQRRFSVSPTVTTNEYDNSAAQVSRRAVTLDSMNLRRHSVAEAYQPPGRRLSDALANLSLESQEGPGPGGYNNLMMDLDEYYGHTPESIQVGANVAQGSNSRRASFSHTPGTLRTGPTAAPVTTYSEVGRGIPLHVLPSNTILYIVEFKAGRSDIFYFADEEGTNQVINKGDLVIVEADRGRDLGKVINNSITPHQIHLLQAQQSEAITDLHRVNREIHPKRIYCLAQQQEVQMLLTKMQDEAKALAVCHTKVRQKKLPMNVVDAEYQWDRRKLTFYFLAERRIDFRELVRDLFKIYKTRIWMCAVSAIQKAPYQDETMDAPDGPEVIMTDKSLQQRDNGAGSGSNSGSPTTSSTLGFQGHPNYTGFGMHQGSPAISPVVD